MARYFDIDNLILLLVFSLVLYGGYKMFQSNNENITSVQSNTGIVFEVNQDTVLPNKNIISVNKIEKHVEHGTDYYTIKGTQNGSLIKISVAEPAIVLTDSN